MPLKETKVTWDKEAILLRDLRLEANARAIKAGQGEPYDEKSNVFERAKNDDKARLEYERRQEPPVKHGRHQGGRNVLVENSNDLASKTYRTNDLPTMTMEQDQAPEFPNYTTHEAESSTWETPTTEEPPKGEPRKRAFPGADWPSPDEKGRQDAIDSTYNANIVDTQNHGVSPQQNGCDMIHCPVL